MKKLLFNKARNSRQPPPQIEHHDEMANSGHTLDRIMTAKEDARRKWLEEQEKFARSRREHEMQMMAMEEAEVARREEEVRRRNDELDDRRRKNRMIQDAVAQQIKTLQNKLSEYKVTHKAEEETLEDEIAGLEDTLSEVKTTLERRKEALQQEMAFPSAPLDVEGSYSLPTLAATSPPTTPSSPEGSETNAQPVYPALPVPATRSAHNSEDELKSSPQRMTKSHDHLRGLGSSGSGPRLVSHSQGVSVVTPVASEGNCRARNYNSSGSSPQTSHASSSANSGGAPGSRSVTPKTMDSSSSEFDTSV